MFAVAVALRVVGVEGTGDVDEAGGVVRVALALAAIGNGVGVGGVGDAVDVGGIFAVGGVGVVFVKMRGRRCE